MKTFILFTSFLFISSCANVPLGENFSSTSKIDKGMALVYVYRPYVEAASAFGVILSINGQKKAVLPTDSYTYFYIEEGTHKINFSWPIAALTEGIEGKLKFVKGKKYFIKYSVQQRLYYHSDPKWVYFSEFIPEDVATKELIDCCKISPSLQ